MKHTTLSVLLSLVLTILFSSCAPLLYPGAGNPDNRTGYPFPRYEKDKDHKDGNNRSYALSELGILFTSFLPSWNS